MFALPQLPPAARNNVERAAIALSRELGDSNVLLGPDCAVYAKDDCPSDGVVPDLVVLAKDAEAVRVTMELAARYGIPVTPRAAGTGRTGGAIPLARGIVLATHGLSSIKEIDRVNRIAVVEPGVITGDLHAACAAEGLYYPPDPNSWAQCMIGGNVGENAAGPAAFKYGSTRDYVLGLQVTLIGGAQLSLGKRTSKGVTGYDLTSLFVGSEGTLGVTTEIVLKLLPAPPQVLTLAALFGSLSASTDAVSAVARAGLMPRCIELMDGPTLAVLRRGGVPVHAAAAAMLIFEVDDYAAEASLEQLGNVLSNQRDVVEISVANSEEERATLWRGRRDLSYATRKLARYKLSEDVVVPRSKMGELLESVARSAEQLNIAHLSYGHAGDGNLHVNFLWDDDAQAPQVSAAIDALMRKTIELGGTLSGEHGIGIAKLPYMHLEQSAALQTHSMQVKAVFDPRGLLNPGKIFSGVHRGC
jgi:glycolate oxidase